MNQYFSSAALHEISENVSRSLTNTFQMMFQLDLSLLPHTQDNGDGQLICSYMDLSYKKARARLSLAISKVSVESIAHNMEPDVTPPSPEIVQDIVCEVTNIVGNHLRSYISDKMGFMMDISLPHPGLPPADADDTSVINLFFRIMENDSVKLGLSYGTQLPA